MGAGTEQLESERGVALLVEAVVVEDVGGAEYDGVAVPFERRDAQQGGQAVAGVAGVGIGRGRRVADAAGVGGASSLGGGQGAAGRERGVVARRGVGGDPGGEAVDGRDAGCDEDSAASGGGERRVEPGLLAVGQQVGGGDQEGGVGAAWRCARPPGW